jgi:hypothetical protein
MKKVSLAAFLLASGMAHAGSEVFYFERAIYTKCPDSSSMPTWKIEGPVSGPWIDGTMHADGKLTSTASDKSSFDFATEWTITDGSGAILLAASCAGTSLLEPMPHSPNTPWWEECTIKSGLGKYASYSGRHILTSGFAPAAGTCVANKSFISGYKIVID